MGIRPSFNLLIGVDDVETEGYSIADSRLSKEIDWDIDVPVPDQIDGKLIDDNNITQAIHDQLIRSMLKDKPMYEVLSWDSEYGLTNVLGYNVASIHGDIAYALAAIHPEYRDTCVKELPSISLEDDDSWAGRVLSVFKEEDVNMDDVFAKPDTHTENILRTKQKKIDDRHNYRYFADQYETYEIVAKYLFDVVGFHASHLKMMLYVKWS